jgi:hypothetical protein
VGQEQPGLRVMKPPCRVAVSHAAVSLPRHPVVCERLGGRMNCRVVDVIIMRSRDRDLRRVSDDAKTLTCSNTGLTSCMTRKTNGKAIGKRHKMLSSGGRSENRMRREKQRASATAPVTHCYGTGLACIRFTGTGQATSLPYLRLQLAHECIRTTDICTT